MNKNNYIKSSKIGTEAVIFLLERSKNTLQR